MKFEQFPALNKQHEAKYEALSRNVFKGEPYFIHEQVEVEVNQEELAKKEAAKAAKIVDPLASTEEEEGEGGIVGVNLKEIDRLHYHVRAIETDCHIVPMGAMKLNASHEV